MSPLLEVDELRVALRRDRRTVDLLDGVSFSVDPAEALGVVGESGCGKSLLALAIMGLLPPGMVARGAVRLGGENLLALPDRALRRIRGRRIAMVFSEPLSALNPLHPIGRQVAEGARVQLRLGRADAERRARALLDRIGLRVPPDTLPHRLSGGQRQRVLLAAALAGEPALLIADEFSTALDPAATAQMMALLADITAERGLALMLVSHDLALVRGAVGRVLVLYAGRVAELGDTAGVFARPAHPYTAGLLAASLHGARRPPATPVPTIPGQVPDPFDRPASCAFAPRCARAEHDCRAALPVPQGPPGHRAACLHPLAAPA